LWWPNGLKPLESNTLYTVSATFTPLKSNLTVTSSRRIGFRLITLVSLAKTGKPKTGGLSSYIQVTADDTDPESLMNSEGTGNLTMRYKVNGANIWARGANLVRVILLSASGIRKLLVPQVPMEQMEGRSAATAYRALMNTARDSHFNALRIWGGG
jgi:hypothetical protein